MQTLQVELDKCSVVNYFSPPPPLADMSAKSINVFDFLGDMFPKLFLPPFLLTSLRYFFINISIELVLRLGGTIQKYCFNEGLDLAGYAEYFFTFCLKKSSFFSGRKHVFFSFFDALPYPLLYATVNEKLILKIRFI